jgi:DNA repair exonuclease SbcCD ATPase subunit
MRSKLSDQREQRIARQTEVLLAQEEALDRRRDEVRRREDRIEEQERELEQRRKQAEFEIAQRTSQLDAREAAIAERERELAGREQVLDSTARKKARSLAREAVSLAERGAEVSRREAAAQGSGLAPCTEGATPVQDLTPSPSPASEDTDELAPAPGARIPDGGWNLNRLERLVEERGGDFPGRLDEWRYYLVYLREFADARGNLPRPFDWLVWSEFEELLTQTAA